MDLLEKNKYVQGSLENLYGRQTVVPPVRNFIYSIVIALLCCNLIKLYINKPISWCKLSVNKQSFPDIYNDDNDILNPILSRIDKVWEFRYANGRMRKL